MSYAERFDLTRKTRAYLADWLAWVERGAPEYGPYRRFAGLCGNAQSFDKFHSQDILDDLDEVFGEELYPFGRLNFLKRWAEGSQHECPERLAFVRANLPEK